ncbi:VWA domain-containing protein [Aeromicrobium sp. A1-2]|uniref:vWA domain-containing protein n=1 Tax=Aeromicrobium sp. A1-2 TaxID=2107713 RepID=UPI0013C32A7E|nr:VWA domain-containing protein [Aeromicrobium sp. A1-2]
MELNTRLDRDRFTWMSRDLTSSDRASMLVEVTAPALPHQERTVPTNLVVVLDRSGSMGGARIEQAKKALCAVVDQLAPGDTFGLVTFDDQVEVPVPAGPVIDRDAVKRRINAVAARGMTDLSAGLVRGLKEARRIEALEGVRVLLVSDGHANAGVTDPVVLGRRTAEFLEHRITTSTLGMGLGYDETVLDEIARQGSGNEHFAQEADAAAAAIGAECGELLGQRFLSCRLTVALGNGVREVRVLNEVASREVEGGVQIELGSFSPEQTKSLVLQFDPKRAPKPGRRKVAGVRFTYVLADDLTDHAVSHTVWAHIAGPDDRPGKVDRDVMAEVVFQGVQRHKRRATDALQYGDLEAARRRYARALRTIRRHLPEVPRNRRSEFEADLAFIGDALARLDAPTSDGVAFIGKSMTASLAHNSRTRDRRRPSA